MWLIIFIVIVILFFAFRKKREKTPDEKDWDEWRNLQERSRKTQTSIPHDIERVIFMGLETFHILNTSTKIDTVYSRLNLLYDVLSSLERPSKLKGMYAAQLERASDFYNNAYYDKPILPMTKEYITNPSVILDRWDEFKDQNLFDVVHRYAIAQDKFISALKTEKAKENRILNVIQMVVQIEELVISDVTKAKLKDLKDSLFATIKRV